MPLIQLRGLGHAFGGQSLFTGLDATIEPGARIGLVGPNGAGKTTLLNILTGHETASAGAVERAARLRLGYLRQEAVEAFAARTNTLGDEMRSVFRHVQAMETRLRTLEAEMAATDNLPPVLDEYGTLLEAFEAGGGYDYEMRIEQTLRGLGLTAQDETTAVTLLSGGQKTRALLARLLLEQPDLLVLDEPTNHLDSEAVGWLEGALRGWPGTLLLVSHDRYFLDAVTTTIWELRDGGLHSYRGNYSAYVRQREERQVRAEKLYQATVEQFRADLDYIKRNIARSSTNGQATGRLRQLSRDLHGIHALGLEQYLSARKWSETGLESPRMYTVAEAEAAVRALPAPRSHAAALRVSLDTRQRADDVVLRAHELTVGYPGRVLFNVDTLTLHRGDVAALVGGNGAGKTTFLRTILGTLRPLAGSIALGQNVRVGYFAQAHDQLDPGSTVLDELLRHSVGVRDLKLSAARSYLAQYLFRGDDVYKPVGALSGGERARLALAVLGLRGANLLLLDEPTNHLDLMAQEELQAALERFDGTMLLVSHDRYLIDRLATHHWRLADGALTVVEVGDPRFRVPGAQQLQPA